MRSWWEPETEWHRAWKNHFPEAWQEKIHHSKDGEKHIADVKTESEIVLEFQHSHLRRDERESREDFYQRMVWVVDGRRRVRDRARFFASLRSDRVVNREPLIVWVPSNEGALLREWAASRKPVYFDFGDLNEPDTARVETPILWRLNPCGPHSMAYLSPVPRTEFLRVHLEGLPFDEMCTEAVERACGPLFDAASASVPTAYRFRAIRG